MTHLAGTSTQSGARAPGQRAGGGPELVEVLVVGAGFAGVGAAMRLLEAGFDDLVVVEAADGVGGVWRDNTYPGAACDIPSVLYSFSFHPNPDWSRWYPEQPEIASYLRDVADSHGVTARTRFGQTVTGARWEEALGRWLVTTTGGDLAARYLVSGMGGLNVPVIPDLPGLAEFSGPVWHSSQWDHSVDLAGKSVAVVGTGASAVQIVPTIAADVAQLHLFQRTPPWVMPRKDRPISARRKRLYRRLPLLQKVVRAKVFWANECRFVLFRGRPSRLGLAEQRARAFLRQQVPDRSLRAQVTPRYRAGCKRILVSDDYFPALGRANVEVVTTGVDALTPTGVRTVDGIERRVDVVVFGTGFEATDPPFARSVVGRDGRTLAEVWAGSMQAYKGTTVAGFPNLFLLVGPNTGLGHNSMVYVIESQVDYVVDALQTLRDQGLATMSPRPEVQQEWNDRLQEQLRDTVWVTGGCHSWYQDPQGRITTLWPSFASRMRSSLRRFDAAAYDLSPAPAAKAWAVSR